MVWAWSGAEKHTVHTLSRSCASGGDKPLPTSFQKHVLYCQKREAVSTSQHESIQQDLIVIPHNLDESLPSLISEGVRG